MLSGNQVSGGLSRDDIVQRFHFEALMIVVPAIVAFLATTIITTRVEGACSTAQLCRKSLNYDGRVFTTSCRPNTMLGGHDLICEDISQCQAAGGFGKFLQAVSGNCRSKTFDGYYGLDGMTFGILDFTSNELPPLFEIYEQRSPDKFKQIFSGINLPEINEDGGKCLDPHWVCQQNQSGYLNCDPKFHAAFELSVRDPDLQKGQLELALHLYLERINKAKRLGLKTQYGLVSLAVVANNLRSGTECLPGNWKQQCQDRSNEAELVDCMMGKYVMGKCRNSAAATQQRAHEIEQVFQNHKNDPYQEPDLRAITGCSTHWGQGSGVHPPRSR